MLTNPTVVIILQYINDQINTLYILNLHHVICQLYLKEAGKQVRLSPEKAQWRKHGSLKDKAE